MTLRKFSFGAAVALAMLGTGPVKAADLDPALEDPVQEMPSLPMSNVVFGSGWYVRGDAAVTSGYTFGSASSTGTTFSSSVRRSGDPAYNFSLGGGYAFTRYLRADITADFFQPAQALLYGQACHTTSLGDSCHVVGQFNSYDALANGYIDLGTWSIMTPYIGAGAGVAFGNIDATLYGDTTLYKAYVGYHNFAYAGMAGVAFDVFPHVKIDVGYRYVNNGKVGTTQVYHHEIRAGLRYMIDN